VVNRTTYARVSRSIVSRNIEQGGASVATSRTVPEEVPIAFTFGGTTHAVMMATPADIEDFAVGFSLSERIISSKSDIISMYIFDVGDGIDVQMMLRDELQAGFAAKRRAMAGPVGCGLCGIESIEDVMRELPSQDDAKFNLSYAQILNAVAQLDSQQQMKAEMGAVHAAGFMGADGTIKLVREDVGRHNALDKLIGGLASHNNDLSQGAIVMTSRVSVDLIQKVVIAGTSILIAVSTPTALAIRTAEAAGLTLVALARKDSFEIYTRPERVLPDDVNMEKNSDVA
jgi:FdhD protein